VVVAGGGSKSKPLARCAPRIKVYPVNICKFHDCSSHFFVSSHDSNLESYSAIRRVTYSVIDNLFLFYSSSSAAAAAAAEWRGWRGE